MLPSNQKIGNKQTVLNRNKSSNKLLLDDTQNSSLFIPHTSTSNYSVNKIKRTNLRQSKSINIKNMATIPKRSQNDKKKTLIKSIRPIIGGFILSSFMFAASGVGFVLSYVQVSLFSLSIAISTTVCLATGIGAAVIGVGILVYIGCKLYKKYKIAKNECPNNCVEISKKIVPLTILTPCMFAASGVGFVLSYVQVSLFSLSIAISTTVCLATGIGAAVIGVGILVYIGYKLTKEYEVKGKLTTDKKDEDLLSKYCELCDSTNNVIFREKLNSYLYNIKNFINSEIKEIVINHKLFYGISLLEYLFLLMNNLEYGINTSDIGGPKTPESDPQKMDPHAEEIDGPFSGNRNNSLSAVFGLPASYRMALLSKYIHIILNEYNACPIHLSSRRIFVTCNRGNETHIIRKTELFSSFDLMSQQTCINLLSYSDNGLMFSEEYKDILCTYYENKYEKNNGEIFKTQTLLQKTSTNGNGNDFISLGERMHKFIEKYEPFYQEKYPNFTDQFKEVLIKISNHRQNPESQNDLCIHLTTIEREIDFLNQHILSKNMLKKEDERAHFMNEIRHIESILFMIKNKSQNIKFSDYSFLVSFLNKILYT